jgi:hypothetical protein
MRSRLVMTLAVGGMLATGTAQAHNDWALPLLGGAVGGYALKSFMGSEQQKSASHAQPVYVAPTPAYVVPSSPTRSVETRLRELDSLAANGYITHQEYEQRRQAILNGI